MQLTRGDRLGSYEVVAPLGRGGMGEVYRAQDSRLDRQVALKIVRAGTADREVLARFEQEARSASALNHPNIVTIYDIGDAPSGRYIAMELIEGRSLRELLRDGPLPLKRALDVAAQLADGLAAAHARGIVHRDLKPENVMVLRDGRVKILDFGLAKRAPAATHDSPTIKLDVVPTEAGVILGTIGYMSPEQAAGGTIDFRADQFALGVILFEMLSGRGAFARSSAVDTLHAIVHDDIDLGLLPNDDVRWIVSRCLAKDPEGRYGATIDLARDLVRVRDRDRETTPRAETVRPRRRVLIAAVIAMAAVLGALAAFLALRPKAAEPPRYTPLTFRQGTVWSARFAPDGKTIVYGALWDDEPLKLFSTRTDSPESRPYELPPADILSISKNGEMAISLGKRIVSGLEATGTLATVPIGGGTPRRLLDNVFEADWDPAGTALAVAYDAGGTTRIEYPPGTLLLQTVSWISQMRFSRDGKRLAFLEHPVRRDNRGFVVFIDLASKKRNVVSAEYSAIWGLAWSPDDDEIWFSSPSQTEVDFALRATTTEGRERVVLRMPTNVVVEDVRATGEVLLHQQAIRWGIVGYDHAAKQARELTWLGKSFPNDLTADGKTLLFTEYSGAASYTAYVRGTDGSAPVKLGSGFPMALSPDGKSVLMIRLGAQPQLTIQPIGLGAETVVPRGSIEQYHWAMFFPDGRRVLFSGNEKGRGVRYWVQSIDRADARAVTPEGMRVPVTHVLSPDGTRFVAATNAGAVAVYDVATGRATRVPGHAAGDDPLGWAGEHTVVVSRGSGPVVKVQIDLRTGTTKPWRELTLPRPAGVLEYFGFLTTPDGSYEVLGYYQVLSKLYAMM